MFSKGGGKTFFFAWTALHPLPDLTSEHTRPCSCRERIPLDRSTTTTNLMSEMTTPRPAIPRLDVVAFFHGESVAIHGGFDEVWTDMSWRKLRFSRTMIRLPKDQFFFAWPKITARLRPARLHAGGLHNRTEPCFCARTCVVVVGVARHRGRIWYRLWFVILVCHSLDYFFDVVAASTRSIVFWLLLVVLMFFL
jgi:hypothetical protein